jgi:hypothetical protein
MGMDFESEIGKRRTWNKKLPNRPAQSRIIALAISCLGWCARNRFVSNGIRGPLPKYDFTEG